MVLINKCLSNQDQNIDFWEIKNNEYFMNFNVFGIVYAKLLETPFYATLCLNIAENFIFNLPESKKWAREALELTPPGYNFPHLQI